MLLSMLIEVPGTQHEIKRKNILIGLGLLSHRGARLPPRTRMNIIVSPIQSACPIVSTRFVQLLQPLDAMIFLTARITHGYAQIVNVHPVGDGVAACACHGTAAGMQVTTLSKPKRCSSGSISSEVLVANPKGDVQKDIKGGNEIRVAAAAAGANTERGAGVGGVEKKGKQCEEAHHHRV